MGTLSDVSTALTEDASDAESEVGRPPASAARAPAIAARSFDRRATLAVHACHFAASRRRCAAACGAAA